LNKRTRSSRGVSEAVVNNWKPLANSNNWYSNTWSSELGIFCMVGGSGGVVTSPDGFTWTSRTTPFSSNLSEIAWSPELGLFCVTAASNTSQNIMTSPDGINWTARTRPGGVSCEYTGIDWSPELGLFCIVGNSTSTSVATSPDGITWTARTAAVSI